MPEARRSALPSVGVRHWGPVLRLLWPAERDGVLTRGLIRRLLGYSGVSALSVLVTQAVLVVCYELLGWPAEIANVTAVCAAAGPAYWVNRRWVWSRTDRHSVGREVLPFWAYNLAGLGLSTLLVSAVEQWHPSAAAVSLANIAAFGSLWVGKFVLLDRVLFARPGCGQPSTLAGVHTPMTAVCHRSDD